MSKITFNSEDLSEIILQLEKAGETFCGLGDGLDCAMLDEDRDLFGEAEILFNQNIRALKNLTGQ